MEPEETVVSAEMAGVEGPVGLVKMTLVPVVAAGSAGPADEAVLVAAEPVAHRSGSIRRCRSVKTRSNRMSKPARGAPVVPGRMPTEKVPMDAPRQFLSASRAN